MSGYMPKVGDKVRATLGESVNVGEVVDMTANNGNCAQIDLGVESWAYCDISDGWHFEQIVDVPTKFGAVIRWADGTVWVQHGDGQWYDIEGAEYVNAELESAGFTVLFEGVDE